MLKYFNHYLLFLLISILLVLSSCARNPINIESSVKRSLVYVETNGKEKKIGKTPMQISYSDINKYAGKNDFASIKIIKFGNVPTYLLVPASWSFAGDFNVKMKKIDSSYFNQLSRKDYTNKLSDIVFDFMKIQSLLEKDNLEDAYTVIKRAEKRHGQIPPLYVLKANYFIAKGDFTTALSLYKKANKLFPKNKNIKKAILFLESSRKLK